MLSITALARVKTCLTFFF
uniref:Uncharacterized protein n=1 Tax=Rhizophora mucronata TaxID=61149 RepID=A0A2P2MZK9_RHIMU